MIYSFKISNQNPLCVCGKCKLVIKFIWKMKKTRMVKNNQDETYSTRYKTCNLNCALLAQG